MSMLSTVARLLRKGAKKAPKKGYKKYLTTDPIERKKYEISSAMYSRAVKKANKSNYAKAKQSMSKVNKDPLVKPAKLTDGSIGKIKNDLAKQKLKLKAADGKEDKLERGVSALKKRLGHVTKLTKTGVRNKAKAAKKVLHKDMIENSKMRASERKALLNKRLKTATGRERRKILEELYHLAGKGY